VREAQAAGVPRYQMEWPVRGIHLRGGGKVAWLDARCTTDKSNMYTMHLVDPALPSPYRTRRHST
jgi:hypothetical protein